MSYLVVALTPNTRIETACFTRTAALKEYNLMRARGYISWITKISKTEALDRESAEVETRFKYH